MQPTRPNSAGGEETHQCWMERQTTRAIHHCWMGRRPTSARWGGDPTVLDGEETHQCWMGGWGGNPPVLDGEETNQCTAGWGGDPPVLDGEETQLMFPMAVNTCTAMATHMTLTQSNSQPSHLSYPQLVFSSCQIEMVSIISRDQVYLHTISSTLFRHGPRATCVQIV